MIDYLVEVRDSHINSMYGSNVVNTIGLLSLSHLIKSCIVCIQIYLCGFVRIYMLRWYGEDAWFGTTTTEIVWKMICNRLFVCPNLSAYLYAVARTNWSSGRKTKADGFSVTHPKLGPTNRFLFKVSLSRKWNARTNTGKLIENIDLWRHNVL